MPFANLAAVPPLTTLIGQQQETLNISDEALADALGYSTPDAIRLIKNGTVRLPMTKVRVMADTLEMEPGEAMYLLLRDTSPELLASIEECLAPLALTRTESRLINRLRKTTAGRTTTAMYMEGASIVGIVFAQ